MIFITCWHYIKPSCFYTFHRKHRSSSQPIWKILNYSQYSMWIISQRECCKWQVWQLGGDGSQIHNYLKFLSACRDLWQARIIPHIPQWGKGVKLSLKNHLHVISACKLLSEGCALIVRCQKWRCFRGREVLKQSSSLLSLCAVVAAVREADRCCKPTHIAVSLMLVFNIFYTDMINAVSGFPSTVDQMRFDLLSTQWVRLPVGSAVILHKSNIVYSRRDIPENSIIIRI